MEDGIDVKEEKVPFDRDTRSDERTLTADPSRTAKRQKEPFDETGYDLSKVPNLSYEEEVFCEHFAVFSNGIKAYQKAHPDSKTHNAAIGAREWLLRPEIVLRINQVRIERAHRLRISGDRILTEIAKIAFYDKTAVYGPTGEKVPEYLQDPDTVNALRPKPADKLKALELLGKNQKLFTERVEHAGDLTVEVVKFAGMDPVTGKIYKAAPPGSNTDDQAMRSIGGETRTIGAWKKLGVLPEDFGHNPSADDDVPPIEGL